MARFRAPLEIYDEDKDINPDAGSVLAMQTGTVTFADTTVSLFNLPANSRIIDFYVDVTTAFNAATTNTLDLGISTSPTDFAAALSIGTVARVLGSSDASQLSNYDDTGNVGITVQARYNQTGTAASAGSAFVTVVYAVLRNLPR